MWFVFYLSMLRIYIYTLIKPIPHPKRPTGPDKRRNIRPEAIRSETEPHRRKEWVKTNTNVFYLFVTHPVSVKILGVPLITKDVWTFVGIFVSCVRIRTLRPWRFSMNHLTLGHEVCSFLLKNSQFKRSLIRNFLTQLAEWPK